MSLINIVDSDEFKNFKSDYCILFAWNHKKEILEKEKITHRIMVNGLFQLIK